MVTMTGVVGLISAARELVVAGYFGTGEAVDAFLIAFLLPTFAISVLAGAFSAAMMPTYIHTRDFAGVVAARRLFSSAMILGIVLLIADHYYLLNGSIN